MGKQKNTKSQLNKLGVLLKNLTSKNCCVKSYRRKNLAEKGNALTVLCLAEKKAGNVSGGWVLKIAKKTSPGPRLAENGKDFDSSVSC